MLNIRSIDILPKKNPLICQCIFISLTQLQPANVMQYGTSLLEILYQEFVLRNSLYRRIFIDLLLQKLVFCSTLYNVVHNKNKNICILSSVPYWKTDPSNHNYKQKMHIYPNFLEN